MKTREKQLKEKVKLNLLLPALIILGVNFTGCNEENNPVDPVAGSELLTIGVDRINTRALDDAFEQMDRIGLYAVKWADGSSPGYLEPSVNYADNVGFTLQDDNDNWQADEPIYYPAEGEKLDLYAYYPYTDNPLESGSTLINFLVHPD